MKNEFRNRMTTENLQNLLSLALYPQFEFDYNELQEN